MTTEEYKAAANFWKTKERKEMPVEELKPAVEEFLRSSTVCALGPRFDPRQAERTKVCILMQKSLVRDFAMLVFPVELRRRSRRFALDWRASSISAVWRMENAAAPLICRLSCPVFFMSAQIIF